MEIKIKRDYDPSEKFFAEDNIPFHHNLPLLDTGKPVRSIQAIVYEAYLQAAPFHEKKNLTVLVDKQLEIILRSSSPHHDEVHNWGKSFAELHKLNYEEILRKSTSKKNDLYGVLKKVMVNLENLLSGFYIYGNKNIPLTDVFQASIVAGTIKSFNPGLCKRVINMFVRLKSHRLGKK